MVVPILDRLTLADYQKLLWTVIIISIEATVQFVVIWLPKSFVEWVRHNVIKFVGG